MRVVVCVALSLAACSDPAKPMTCAAGFIGDPAQPPQMVAIYTDGISQQLAEVTAGQPIPLEPPPQGGYVMYIAARVLNMDACVQFSGKLTDPATGNEAGFDARSATLVVHDDGWGWPDPRSNSNLSNVNGCPDYSARDVEGQSYTLDMTVTDKDGRRAAVTLPIVPTCALADPFAQADCVCHCTANYVLGRCSPMNTGE
jgi:hypothetical protein